jgi:hypothetical protein
MRAVDRSKLAKLTSHELHDRALELARDRLDVGFLWSLLKAVPVARATQGDLGEADADIASVSALLSDVVGSGQGDVAEGLRPLYIDYLANHSRD